MVPVTASGEGYLSGPIPRTALQEKIRALSEKVDLVGNDYIDILNDVAEANIRLFKEQLGKISGSCTGERALEWHQALGHITEEVKKAEYSLRDLCEKYCCIYDLEELTRDEYKKSLKEEFIPLQEQWKRIAAKIAQTCETFCPGQNVKFTDVARTAPPPDFIVVLSRV
jgi:hypothetical protein